MAYNITINGNPLTFEENFTILQACRLAGLEVPVFCYHERLEIAGNCRMCLVDVEGAPKPAASCAVNIVDGMKIHTNTQTVKENRESNLEFLLINHPLDCPVCDQGGECDLQDITMKYGKSSSAFKEGKRAVEPKNFGPLIKTDLTRCIHCTRCVRFLADVAGSVELGAVGRGEDMEISTKGVVNALEAAIKSELSGNIIDLCPVGALTNKPASSTYRSWELRSVPTIDVMDAVGSNILTDFVGMEIKRILPRENDEINEEWISDKTRFCFDGLKAQRIRQPFLKRNGKLEPITWKEAVKIASEKISETLPEKTAALAGALADGESMFMLKTLLHNLSVYNIDCRENCSFLPFDHRALYCFNTGISGIDQADYCLIVGANPRYEATIINTRLRKNWRNRDLQIALIGHEVDLTYEYDYLGADLKILDDILEGSHEICKALEQASSPMIVLGVNLFRTQEIAEYAMSKALQIAKKYEFLTEDWNGFNILHNAASVVGGIDVGFVPKNEGMNAHNIIENSANINLLFLLNVDDIDTSKIHSRFVIYLGSHGDRGATCADLVLPGLSFIEKEAIYVNTEGRAQSTMSGADISSETKARPDWEIIKSIMETLEMSDIPKNLEELRSLMAEYCPNLGNLRIRLKNNLTGLKIPECDHQAELIIPETLDRIEYFLNNCIARHSKNMQACAALP